MKVEVFSFFYLFNYKIPPPKLLFKGFIIFLDQIEKELKLKGKMLKLFNL